MKNIIIFFFLFSCFYGNAQAPKPLIAANTELDYLVVPRGGGIATITMRINFASADSISMSWAMGIEAGRYRMNRQALKYASSCSWERPIDGTDVFLNADQSLLTIPDSVFHQLTITGQMKFDEQIFKLHQKEELTVGGRKLNTLHLKSNNGETEYWVVADVHAFIVKVIGNTAGPNVELQDIRQKEGAAF